MTALLEGPSTAETQAGLATAVPAGTRLLGLSIANGTASVDLSSRFGSGGGSESVFMRLAQVAYTLTQFPSVDRVRFLVGGERARVFSTEGLILAETSTRKDFADRLPPVSVEWPSVGGRVTSPVAVSGTADVFEGTVSIRILDARGRVIASSFTTATCGTGCRGTFSKLVAFHVDSAQGGTVQAFEVSMRDGRPRSVVSIPLTLVG